MMRILFFCLFVANLVGQSWEMPDHSGGGCTACRPNGEENCRNLKKEQSACTSSILCCNDNGKCHCQESSIACKGAFTQSHDTKRQCVQCCPSTCGDPDSSESTTYEITGQMAGDNVMYSCKAEYDGMIGDQQRTCQEDGTWTGTAPFCVIYSVCGGDFTDESGILISHSNFGASDYPQYYTCVSTITVSEPNKISVTFTDFGIEYHSSCDWDYIEVRDGSNVNAPLIGKYCGDTAPAPFQTTGNVLFVYFYTDDFPDVGLGFRAIWESVP